MEPPERPAEVVASKVIAHLQQSVQALMDGDRILPADGLPLLATLDQEPAGPDGVSAAAGLAGIEAFIGWAQALIEAGVLAAEDGRPRIEAAVAMGALLRSASGTNLKTPGRQGPPLGESAARPQADHTTEAEAERRPPLAERQTK
jgi:hypothetical protein